MEGLAMAIQGRAISFPDGPIRGELDSFEYTYTATGGVKYSAPVGMHDDCVVALSLAVHHLHNRPRNYPTSPVGLGQPGSPFLA
jgi:hypothetical protein